jgi:transcriptional regulator with XRE-family HTH domain
MIHYYSPERLRSLRQRAMLSQRDVERLTGISDATIAYLECGRHRPQCGMVSQPVGGVNGVKR